MPPAMVSWILNRLDHQGSPIVLFLQLFQMQAAFMKGDSVWGILHRSLRWVSCAPDPLNCLSYIPHVTLNTLILKLGTDNNATTFPQIFMFYCGKVSDTFGIGYVPYARNQLPIKA